jgi:hypothetical protein
MAKRYSQNGYLAATASLIAQYTIPGTDIKVNLRKGDVSVVMLYLADQYNKRVEKLTKTDTGSYNVRSIIDARTLSNHASGTAEDFRWNKHPLGKKNTFTPKQRETIEDILHGLEGVVRWGGHYTKRVDEMHFEINAGPAAVKRVADKIRTGTIGKTEMKPVSQVKQTTTDTLSTLKEGDSNSDVKALQRDMNRVFPAYSTLRVDGDYGPATKRVIMEFQERAGIPADGIVGPQTRATLRKYGVQIR